VPPEAGKRHAEVAAYEDLSRVHLEDCVVILLGFFVLITHHIRGPEHV